MTHPLATPRARLDHFVVAIDDLDRGIDAFEARTGVRPVPGGEHPDLGTHNALVSLGPDRYLEILAPRPGATVDPSFRGVAEHRELTPYLWALATDDVDVVRAALHAHGFPVPEITPGSRRTGNGALLRWSMLHLGPEAPPGSPFFIQWLPGGAHPATTAPTGCTLEGFTVASSEPDELRGLLAAVEMDAAVTEGPASTIELETPRGRVTLGD